jgi:Electron transfer DM13
MIFLIDSISNVQHLVLMNKQVVLLVSGLVILVILVGSWLYINSQKSTTSRSVVTQSLPSGQVVKSGKFIEIDAVHKGSGGVTINKNGEDYIITLGSDFSVVQGPDLYVWLVEEQKLGAALGGVKTDSNSYLDLGKLTSNLGQQSYSITAAEYSRYNYAVVIWCRAFGVQFSHAILN